MRNDPRLQIIRLVAAFSASLILSPEWAWLMPILGLMFTPAANACDDCDGTKPTQMQVDLSGFTDGACTNCNEYYNISFVLTQSSNCTAIVAPVSTDCRWHFTLTNFCTSVFGSEEKYVCVRVFDTAGNYEVDVLLGGVSSFPLISWIDTSPGATKPTCSGFSSRSIPYSSGSLGLTCTHDGSAALVTAL
jgi:hypothetical protein